MKRFVSFPIVVLSLAAPGAIAAERSVSAPAPERLSVVTPSELPLSKSLASDGEVLGVIPNEFPDSLELGELRRRSGSAAQGGPLTPAISSSESAGVDAFPFIDVSFNTVTDGWVPPDPVMAAGPQNVVVLLNTEFAIYSRTGAVLQGATELKSFFGIPSNFTDFDPLAIWDPHSRRFIVAAMANAGSASDSRIYLAFSQTEDATGDWNTYFIDADLDQDDNWADYASIGIDRNAVYVTANMFRNSGSFSNVTLFIYDKEDGYAGRALDNTHLIDVRTSSGGSPFRLRPAWVNEVVPGDEYYLVQSSTSFSSTVNLFRLNGDRFNGPVLTHESVGLPGFYSGAGSARQPNPSSGVSTLSGSVWAGYYRNGKIWTSHAIQSGSDIRAWVHRIDVSSPTAVREETYEIGETGKDLYFPYVVPDTEDDDFAMLAAYSSPTDYPTARYFNVGADGTVRQAETLIAGIRDNTSGRHGDYFAMGEDPDDPNRIWMMMMYMRTSTQIGQPRVASVLFEDQLPPSDPPPVPDGKTIAGQLLEVEKAVGSEVTVSWDASTCTAPDYHLVWYDLTQLATYDVVEETCGVGTSGLWTGLPPGGLVGVIAVGLDDTTGTESSHGVDSAGAERPSNASTCATTKITTGTCAP